MHNPTPIATVSEPSTQSFPCTPLSEATDLISTLPPSLFSFAYGSGAVPQAGVRSSSRMLDLIIVVDDAQTWHETNMSINPQHYSVPMRLLGPRAAAITQRSSFGARVYYNTILPSYITPTSRPFKYGVVTRRDLEKDLLTWESLYISGRMHKPIAALGSPPSSLADAINQNRSAAAAAALLSLPEQFKEHDLYAAVAGLSYTGDPRVSLKVEVRSKVRDIVMANIHEFRELYASTSPVKQIAWKDRDGIWSRGLEYDTQTTLLKSLPKNIRRKVGTALGFPEKDAITDAVAKVDAAVVGKAVVGVVATVVARASIRQSLKGIATAGIGTSARYVAAKLKKSVRNRFLTTRSSNVS